jgi:hypothetical protein
MALPAVMSDFEHEDCIEAKEMCIYVFNFHSNERRSNKIHFVLIICLQSISYPTYISKAVRGQ